MSRRNWSVLTLVFLAMFVFTFCSEEKGDRDELIVSSNYEDLLSLFKEWREFQKPKMTEGVPDYRAAAMEEQRRGLEKYQSRLAAIDCSSWPISQQVDYHIVRAEMNGLEFDHRVLRPWSRDPSFYAVVSPQFGPQMYGSLNIPKLPLNDNDIAEFRMKLQAIPKVLEQARVNLIEEAKDLWFLGVRAKRREHAILTDLAKQLAAHHPDLVADADRAGEAVDEFRNWLEEKQSKMTAPSGIGIENYNWYMKNVYLVPYTWEEQLVIVQHELERALACLELEENKNRKLAQLEPVKNEEEFRRRFKEAADYIMEFYRKEEIFSVADYMRILPRGGSFVPPGNLLDFFLSIEYRDSLPMRCHGTHQLDDLREERNQHPIRKAPLLYFIEAFRSEGLATGNEEMMMHLGLFDERSPRVRELIYILVANRAARAIGDLKMHSKEFSIEDAVDFAVEWTPRGWLPREGDTIWYDEQLYLRQPGYGTSYIVGKARLHKLLADRSHQLGDNFTMKQFMDEFYASGMIPITLTRWEMTGLEDEIKKLW